MQTYVQAKYSEHEGRALWLSILADLRAQHLVAPSLRSPLIKLAFLLPLLGATLALTWAQGSVWILCAASVGLSLLLSQFAFIGHDAGHGSVSRNPGLNRMFGQIMMTVINGLAFDEWVARHRTHHRFCQVEDRDPDMAVSHVVSLTKNSRNHKGPLGQLLTRYQGLHVWFFSLLFGHSQRILSQAAVIMNLQKFKLDAAMLIGHYLLWFALPCWVLDVPVSKALWAYLMAPTLMGPHLAAIFWVNHIGMPLVREGDRVSFIEHQALTSRTILNPPVWNWLFGGLNFQIEHHLFPQVPSTRLAAVQVIVREHFHQNQIPYQGVTWWSAVKSVATHLRAVGRAP